MGFICFNGKMMPADEPVLLAANRGYRYGDGLFETIKVFNGKIFLEQLHFERLFSGLAVLKFTIPEFFSQGKISEHMLQLCQKNNCSKLARVRLSVSRGDGGLYDSDMTLQYIIECWPLSESVNQLNENGLVIDIFPDVQKSCDRFSNLKSANFLPYSMAALYAKENQLNDCLLLNTIGSIADSTIANVFLVKKDKLITPDLGQGCVSGVTRKYLLQKLRDAGYDTRETAVSAADIEMADEVFLTNAINGIRWVKQFRGKRYSNVKTTKIYDRFIKTIPL